MLLRSRTEEAGTDADLLAEQAEAEAAEAESVAEAARARARALRQEAVSSGETPTDDAEEPADVHSSARARLRFRRPRWTTVAACLALLCTAALLGASGYMTWEHQKRLREERNRAEFTAAARQIVVNLMSIDFNNANDDVQRIIDSSTGPFKDDFQHAAEDFIKVAQDAKVTTNATANAAAVESMTDSSAVVLVTASSTVTNAAGAKDAPRTWRLSVDLQRDGDQIKMSKMEFVP